MESINNLYTQLSGQCVPKGQLVVWGRSLLSWARLDLSCFPAKIGKKILRTALLFVVGFFKAGFWVLFFSKYLGSFSSTKRLLKIPSFYKISIEIVPSI